MACHTGCMENRNIEEELANRKAGADIMGFWSKAGQVAGTVTHYGGKAVEKGKEVGSKVAHGGARLAGTALEAAENARRKRDEREAEARERKRSRRNRGRTGKQKSRS